MALEFYIDASIPIGVARAIDQVRDDVWYPGKPGCPVATPATKDRTWLPIVGDRGWIVLMRDQKIRRRPGERIALMDADVRAFCITAGNATRWETLRILVRHWDTIVARVDATDPPFIYAVRQGSVDRQPLSDPRQDED